MDMGGPDLLDSRDPIFSDSRDPIFNSSDSNRVPKTPLKKPCLKNTHNFLLLMGNLRLLFKSHPVVPNLFSSRTTCI